MSGTGLLTYASPWQNESGNNRCNSTVRKRQSTLANPSTRMNKTIKKQPSTSFEEEEEDDYSVEKENFQSLTPASIEDASTRSAKVQDIINNIGSVKPENDGTSLTNFNPVNYPTATPVKSPVKTIAPFYESKESTSSYLGNYKDIYNSSSRIGEYPYVKPNSSSNSILPMTDKFTEKINYMIHLLEEQQKEPTKHITEEFILYTFLGIFVIYIVDSFARVGKYIR
jgi:hypothetical protein